MPQKKNKENPNAFKNWINSDTVHRLADALASTTAQFNHQEFRKISKELAPLELKARVKLLSLHLYKNLPQNFSQSVSALLKSLKKGNLKGFDLWPYTDFIQTYGLNHTQKFLNCAHDANIHVRRWSSEGTRPRLPWGERLDHFIENPHLTLPILEVLKYDDELYVRKSVANHLNDIAKDHPALVVKILKKWRQESPKEQLSKIDWITRHALRTLIKKGHPDALKLMGVSTTAQAKLSSIHLNKKIFKIGENLHFEFTISSTAVKKQKLIVDYIIHHQKAGGKKTPKVFKLKTFELKPKQSLHITKKHSLKPVTTRKYYPGEHSLEIQVNGKSYGKQDWLLKI
jgi:3-methyladenine DNA glycosylase AlkC